MHEQIICILPCAIVMIFVFNSLLWFGWLVNNSRGWHYSCAQVKGLSKEEHEARNDLASAMRERIEAIPDGSTTAVKTGSGGGIASASYTGIKIDSTFGNNFGLAYLPSFIYLRDL